MRKTIKLLLTGAAVIVLAACSGHQFKVDGQITGAKDSVLHFENVGLNGIEELGKVTLDEDGSFSFSGDAPEAPEFYRLRISDQIINVAIDSTETITIKSQYPQMATQYEVSGSDDNQKIKELALKQIALQERAIAMERSNSLLPSEIRDSLQRMLFTYKEEVKRDYIFKEPYKSYSYFALFQTLGPWLIFDPKNNSDDVKVFAAVATSWDTFYPGALRGENLHNIAIEGMKNIRIIEARNQPRVVEESKVVQTGVIDIALSDNHGKTHRLTDLKGQVVLLDFHIFATDESPARILMMRELYNKYHSQGLEIYQVSLDADEHFWKQQTAALPWISVRDADGIRSSRLMIYNIQAVPDYFIIDRGNNLVKRAAQMNDLEAEIKKLL
jgi:peroxiredoxin